MSSVEVFSPAKINLFLAVTGRRPDGFHDLVSVVSPLAWGDHLMAEAGSPGGPMTIVCDDPAVPLDGSNLVLRAAERFRAASGWDRGARFTLRKRIPIGAGLGGGSSNAAAALTALNRLAGLPMAPDALRGLAAEIGSDCALFLAGKPLVMRGRGERLAELPEGASARIRGRRVLVFKPGFGISTPWAYGRIAAAKDYLPAEEAERRLAAWVGGTGPAEALLLNTMEGVAFAKYPALPVLLDRLRAKFGLQPRMSGSGSACFSLLPEKFEAAPAVAAIREAWGSDVIVVETRFGAFTV